jgi:hypothetical protein
MHGIDLACQLILTVTVGNDIVRSSELLRIGHVIVLAEVDNLHDL